MLRVLPGESRPFCLYDLIQPGSGPLAAAVTVTLRLIDAADIQVVVPVTAALSGTSDWCATLTMPTVLGSYRLEAAITPTGGTTTYQHEVVLVGPRYDVGHWTLRDLRRRVGRLLGDLRPLRATAATGSGTFTDANTLLLPNNAYTGRYAYCARGTGTNQGTTRFVAGSSAPTATLTFATAFPAAFAIGDELDLCNERGIGWLPDDYHQAISVAVRDAGDMGGVPLGATLTAAFDGTTGRVLVPSVFDWLHAVEYRPAAQADAAFGGAAWLPVERAADVRGAGWWLGGDGYLELTGRYAELANTGSVRVWGTGRPDDLTSDEEATLVNAEYVAAAACAHLLFSGIRMDPERERRYAHWSGEARRLKVQAVPMLDGESVTVRR